MSNGYEFTVEDVVHITGRGWLHTGKVKCEREPLLGEACAYGVLTTPNIVTVLAFEGFAIPNWWRHPIGVLCKVELSVGTVLRGNTK